MGSNPPEPREIKISVICHVGKRGRVVLPYECRETYDIKDGSKVRVIIEEVWDVEED